jgi:hypothetical protein
MTPQEKKYLKYGSISLGIGILIYLLFQKSDNGGSINDPTGNGSTTPINTSFNANIVAEMLYNAMREMGTNENKIINALRTVTPTQFDLVFKAFGTRQYNSTTGNQYAYLPFQTLPFVNLQGWLESELSADEYENLRRKYPTKL